MWHDQGKWVTCQQFQFCVSYSTFSCLENAYKMLHFDANPFKLDIWLHNCEEFEHCFYQYLRINISDIRLIPLSHKYKYYMVRGKIEQTCPLGYYNLMNNWTNISVQRTRTKQLRAPLTTMLGHPKSTQCNFNSCSFNYWLDYNKSIMMGSLYRVNK